MADLNINGVNYNGVEGININGNMFYPNAVRYDVLQALPESQKAIARLNIGVPEIEEIVQQVITALGTPVFGRVDENNNIILTGDLAEGTYTVKYEDAEGEQTTIGTLEHDPNAPTYTNWIPLSTDANGNIFNGIGYKTGSRVSSSDGTVKAITNPNAVNAAFCTGYITVQKGNIISLENCWIDTRSLDDAASPYGYRTWGLNVIFYANKGDATGASATWDAIKSAEIVTELVESDNRVTQFKVNTSAPYMRITLGSDDPSQAILTINEEIV